MNNDSAANLAIHLASRVPLFVRSALILSDAPDVAKVLNRLDVQTIQQPLSDLVLPPTIDAESFDAIIIVDCGTVAERLPGILDAYLPVLARHGYFILAQRPPADPALESLNRDGLGSYRKLEDPTYTVFYKVRSEYNPVEHARTLLECRQPLWGYEILRLIPLPYLYDPGVRALVAAEQMVCLLHLDGDAEGDKRLGHFAECNSLFYQVTAFKPDAHYYYQCHAEFWNRIGRPDMASRLLEAVDYVSPTPEVRVQLAQYADKRAVEDEWMPPAWDERFKPRLLMVTHPRPHYGLDIVYDGLKRVLGAEYIVEFPFKPSLHGVPATELTHYPCAFNWAGRALAIDEAVRLIEDDAFDAILFCDIEHDLDADSARRIVHAADVPVFLIDQQDECNNPRTDTMRFLELDAVAGLFKREMLAGVDYGANTWPLPFAYPEEHVPASVSGPREHGLFWAGHRQVGLRRLYLEWLERVLERPFGERFEQAEYARRLLHSRIGINLFGYGFDTVRYWELPAHGCLLFSERPPIRIPLNFEDGKSCVFFDTVQDCETKLRYWMENAEEAAAIAEAGYRHLCAHHTGSARARHLLGWMQARL